MTLATHASDCCSKTSSHVMLSLITGISITDQKHSVNYFFKKTFFIFCLTSRLWRGRRDRRDVKNFFHFFTKKTPRLRGVFSVMSMTYEHLCHYSFTRRNFFFLISLLIFLSIRVQLIFIACKMRADRLP